MGLAAVLCFQVIVQGGAKIKSGSSGDNADDKLVLKAGTQEGKGVANDPGIEKRPDGQAEIKEPGNKAHKTEIDVLSFKPVDRPNGQRKQQGAYPKAAYRVVYAKPAGQSKACSNGQRAQRAHRQRLLGEQQARRGDER